MPLEMGMALFYALQTQHLEHACAFLVPDAHHYQRFASDLAGLDPLVYDRDEEKLLTDTFDWLREVAPPGFRSDEPTVNIVAGYSNFRSECTLYAGSGFDGRLSHVETRELMYRVASERGWWDWRQSRAGHLHFPTLPLAAVQ